MAMNSDYLDAIADYGASQITHVGLADGDTEITGGDYSRQAISWNSASNGNISASAPVSFDVPGGSTTVSQVQFYSSGGDVYGTTEVTPETFAGAGTYTLSSVTINHNAA